MKKLGICIPTYKRPDFLRKCIESILVNNYEVSVEIIIIDDSICNINADIYNQFEKKIRVIKNKKNLGIDGNIQKAVENCNSEYAWIIGEDDQFLPHSIVKILDLLQKYNTSYIFSNYYIVNNDCTKILNAAFKPSCELFIPIEDFIKNYIWRAGFIGANIVNVRKYKETNPTKFEGTYFTHIGRILQIIRNESSVLVQQEPLVLNRAGDGAAFTWKEDSFGVFLGYEKMCYEAIKIVPNFQQYLLEAIRKYRSEFNYYGIKTLLRLRSDGAFNNKQFNKYIKDKKINFIYKKIIFIISYTPINLLKMLIKIYKFTK
jgi:glycosyltransferase involved in cell wall biosynthesis